MRPSETTVILPPLPPSPPSGPPFGTYFSLRKLTHPIPPSPASTIISASSIKFIFPWFEGRALKTKRAKNSEGFREKPSVCRPFTSLYSRLGAGSAKKVRKKRDPPPPQILSPA